MNNFVLSQHADMDKPRKIDDLPGQSFFPGQGPPVQDDLFNQVVFYHFDNLAVELAFNKKQGPTSGITQEDFDEIVTEMIGVKWFKAIVTGVHVEDLNGHIIYDSRIPERENNES